MLLSENSDFLLPAPPCCPAGLTPASPDLSYFPQGCFSGRLVIRRQWDLLLKCASVFPDNFLAASSWANPTTGGQGSGGTVAVSPSTRVQALRLSNDLMVASQSSGALDNSGRAGDLTPEGKGEPAERGHCL